VELLIFVAVVWLIFGGGLAALFGWVKGLFGGNSTSEARSPQPDVRTKPPAPHTYRPLSSNTPRPISFTPSKSGSRGVSDLKDINDAFTGRRLDLSLAIFECVSCHVFYQAASFAVLREANSSRCMVCGSTQIVEQGLGQTHTKARNYTPDTVTLNNYRQHTGHVITFTGLVHDVKQSRRGVDYAVMFEHASWTKGLKMVAFKGGVRKLGGAAMLRSYKGKTLTIRGLLIHDPVFGPEIIVDDPAMIVRVDP
jgi:hypothetical protein